jgi:hypothetical protein
MLKNLIVYLKYPSTALIISTMWIGTAALIIYDRSLPIYKMIGINLVVSFLIGYIGFRVDKK